ncbi:MAG: PD-(D/E)XK nuclease family protein, partial [Proteobacteria bacterium]|nr:PD-(D/E)XK nuclease family protein [Pseudomonadota bacterium]
MQEHIYPADDAAANWDTTNARLPLLIEAFVASEAYQNILSLPPEDIIEVDESFQSMLFDETRVFAIPDVLVSSGAGCRIIDWKTGDVEHESIRMQTGVYVLYAHLKYGIEEDAIEVSIVDLAGGGESVQPAGGVPSLQETTEFIRNSMADMRSLQDSLKYNTVAIEKHPMTDDLT